jgi:hypothetical protein
MVKKCFTNLGCRKWLIAKDLSALAHSEIRPPFILPHDSHKIHG